MSSYAAPFTSQSSSSSTTSSSSSYTEYADYGDYYGIHYIESAQGEKVKVKEENKVVVASKFCPGMDTLHVYYAKSVAEKSCTNKQSGDRQYAEYGDYYDVCSRQDSPVDKK